MNARDRVTRLSRAAARLPSWPAIRRAAQDTAAGGSADSTADEAEARVREGFWPKLRRNIGRLPFAEDLVAAYYAMLDPVTPASAKAILAGALAYFVIPTDLIPDMLIGTGFLDDATVLGFALQTVAKSIRPRHRDRAARGLERGTVPSEPDPA